MRLGEDDLQALLDERMAATTRTQIIGWAAGSLERSYSLRIAEIEAAVSAHTPMVVGASMTGVRSVSRQDRQRLSEAVDTYFTELEAHAREVAASLQPDDEVEPEEALPHEQLLILTNVLVGGEQLDALAVNLTSEIRSAADLDVLEQLLGERLLSTRSSVVHEGLLVAAMSALEDLVLPLVRLGIMTTERFGDSDDDDGPYMRRLLHEAKQSIQGGPGRWRGVIHDLSGLDPADLVADWDLLVEAHLRRNTIVHHGGRVDPAYTNRLPPDRLRPGLGQPLDTTRQYVEIVLASLLAVGVGIATLWPVLLAKEPSPQRLMRPNRTVVHLLNGGHWGDARALATALAPHEADEATRHALRVNAWMAAREIAGSPDQIRAEVEDWTPPNDSITWSIARAALLAQNDELRQLLHRSSGRNNEFVDYTSWPLLRHAASHDPSIRALVYRPRRRRR